MVEALHHISVAESPISFIPKSFYNFEADIPNLPPLIREDLKSNSEDGRMVSEKEYWMNYYEHPDFNYEWNDGILEVKSVGDFASYIQSDWFISVIKENLKTTKIGMLVGLEIGFKLVLPNKTSIRKPDLAVILASNPVQIEPHDCTYKGCFDMCIEFLSDSDKKGLENDTVVKKIEYSQAGVKEYFILDRKKKETAFYRLNSMGMYEEIKPRDGVIESQVLPGFKFRIKDLYSLPALEELINDEIYQPYVLKSYQEQSQKAEKERLRAEKAEKKIEVEQQKTAAERLRAEKAEKIIEVERQKAEAERQKAEAERQKAEAERQRAEKAEKAIEMERQKALEAKKLAAELQTILKKRDLAETTR